MLMWVAWSVETCAQVYRHARAHTHTDTHTHHFPDNTAGSVYAISEKSSNVRNSTLSLQNRHTCILTILLHYHLAGNLILMNYQNVIKYVKS